MNTSCQYLDLRLIKSKPRRRLMWFNLYLSLVILLGKISRAIPVINIGRAHFGLLIAFSEPPSHIHLAINLSHAGRLTEEVAHWVFHTHNASQMFREYSKLTDQSMIITTVMKYCTETITYMFLCGVTFSGDSNVVLITLLVRSGKCSLRLEFYRNTWPHDDVIKWKHFPHHWPLVRGIHRSHGALMVVFYLRLNKRLRKQSRRLWFGTPSRSLWHHSNVHWSNKPCAWIMYYNSD